MPKHYRLGKWSIIIILLYFFLSIFPCIIYIYSNYYSEMNDTIITSDNNDIILLIGSFMILNFWVFIFIIIGKISLLFGSEVNELTPRMVGALLPMAVVSCLFAISAGFEFASTAPDAGQGFGIMYPWVFVRMPIIGLIGWIVGWLTGKLIGSVKWHRG